MDDLEEHKLADLILVRLAELKIRADRIMAKNPMPQLEVVWPLRVQDDGNRQPRQIRADCVLNQ